MTSAVLTQAPLAAGGAVLGALARVLRLGVALYGRAPLTNTALTGLAAFSLMASANAMFLQEHRHPAPLFVPAATVEVAATAPTPVAPAMRPKPAAVTAGAPVTTTGSLKPQPAIGEGPIGNDEVMELQVKLKALGLLDGAADGLYGPKTASAIRRFEERAGLKPKGELTREILAAVRAAPIAAVPALPEVQMPAPTAAPQVTTTAEPAEAPAAPQATMAEPADTLGATPLPAPAPLAPAVQVAAAQPAAPAGRQLPQNGNQLMQIASDVAGGAVNTFVAAVNGDMRMGPADQPMPPRPEETAAVAPTLPAGTGAEPAAEAAGGGDALANIVTAEMPRVPTVPPATSVNDPKLIAKVQRGLASLGFLRGQIDGIAGETTAKAIRNFEVWNNYEVTGRVSPQLLDLLIAAGAQI